MKFDGKDFTQMVAVPEEHLDEDSDWGGDPFLIKDWIECVKSGGFIDYDGYGELAVKTDNGYNVSNVVIYPSFLDDPEYEIPSQFTHVFWYNK